MAGVTGSALYLAFGSGTTVLDTDYRNMSPDESIGLVDQSAGADADKTFLTTLKEGSASATIVIQAADTTTWGALVPGSEGTLEWAEEGTAATKPRHYVNAIVKRRRKAVQYADLLVADVEWQFSGAVTDTTY